MPARRRSRSAPTPSATTATRPRYPQALVDRIIAASPGTEVLDVGIGTGVSAQPFRAARVPGLGSRAR